MPTRRGGRVPPYQLRVSLSLIGLRSKTSLNTYLRRPRTTFNLDSSRQGTDECVAGGGRIDGIDKTRADPGLASIRVEHRTFGPEGDDDRPRAPKAVGAAQRMLPQSARSIPNLDFVRCVR